MKYLVDTSALIRILRRQASADWDDLDGRGLLAVCEPTLTETLLIAKTNDYAALEDSITSNYLPVAVPFRAGAEAAPDRRRTLIRRPLLATDWRD